MEKNQEKLNYLAPKMEATSFKAEHGYAASVKSTGTKITMASGSL